MTEMNSKNENSPICKDRGTFTHNSNKKNNCPILRKQVIFMAPFADVVFQVAPYSDCGKHRSFIVLATTSLY